MISLTVYKYIMIVIIIIIGRKIMFSSETSVSQELKTTFENKKNEFKRVKSYTTWGRDIRPKVVHIRTKNSKNRNISKKAEIITF